MRIVSPEVIAHLASAKKLSRAYTEDMLYREIDRLIGETKRIVGDEQYVISEWLIERASWLEKNSHGEDVVAISAELKWAADAIAAGEYLK